MRHDSHVEGNMILDRRKATLDFTIKQETQDITKTQLLTHTNK